LGSSLSVRSIYPIKDNTNYGATHTLSLYGALRFQNWNNYIQGEYNQTDETERIQPAHDSIATYVQNTRAISWTDYVDYSFDQHLGGGILHGTWTSDDTFSESDRRLKENVQNLDETLLRDRTRPELLRELRPVSYLYKDQGRAGEEAGRTRFGFVADEMQKTMPHIVRSMPHKGDETRLGIVYQDLLAFLTATLQGLSKEMGALMPQLASVEQRIAQRRKYKRARRRKRKKQAAFSAGAAGPLPGQVVSM
jgi:hypothetical protein